MSSSPTPTSPSSNPTNRISPTSPSPPPSAVQEVHMHHSTHSRSENATNRSQNRPEVAMDLRHMTSAGALAAPSSSSRRVSQRIGSKSPASIPSSPTSVHSSSSAIFERDIEPVIATSPSHQLHHSTSPSSHPPSVNPHRIPRVKLEEQSVPSVLDSAAEILAGVQDEGDQMQVAVEAPAMSMLTDGSAGGKSPMSFRSRSPSPGIPAAPAPGSLLFSVPAGQSQSTQPSTTTNSNSLPHPTSPIRPSISTNVPAAGPKTNIHDAHPSTQTPGSMTAATPTSAYFSTTSSVESSPKTTTRERASDLPDSPDRDVQMISPVVPYAPPPSAIEAFSPLTFSTSPPRSSTTASSSPPQSIASSPRQPAQTLSSPSSPQAQKVSKRISFVSYTDLLTSAPVSTVPLSTLTNSVEPPPHIPSVVGLTSNSSEHAGSKAPSIRNSPGVIPSVKEREALDDLGLVGGEWEREGLGRGLEERLEAIVAMGHGQTVPGVVGKA
ncbi:hypothetical protein PM082_004620 [Marasmius tenuissimus]|nr:hypothetical protein PM082_004620 [Marasmius tenuissimus]